MAESMVISDHILELRYEPMGSFLGIRGEVADTVKRDGQFKHWSITSNRVDFWNEDNREDDPETGFVSFRNCGYQLHNPQTRNYFPDRAGKFLRTLDEKAQIKISGITRLGIRAKWFCGSTQTFDQIRDQFYKSFYGSLDRQVFNGEVEDAGVSLNFRRGNIYLNTHSGPMLKDQAMTLIRVIKHEEFPPQGLFLDVDCFLKDLGDKEVGRLVHEIRELHDESWVRLDKLRQFLGI